RRPATAFNEDGTLNSFDHPARRGSLVKLFATGYPELDGPLKPGSLPLPETMLSTRDFPQVWIGQWDASVISSFASPDYPGLWQIDLQIPDDPEVTKLMPL